MSRCFPFPPPGYDRKLIREDAVVLKEEKQKVKKHKKEKKDKEKRDRKEKKDKERSEGKHKEKKDKRDKHKDKKEKHREKEKDRRKEKEKSGTSEVRVVGLAEGKSGEKVGTKEGKDNSNYIDEKNCVAGFLCQNGEEPVKGNFVARETEESKYVQEWGRRTKDQEKVTSHQPERFSGSEKRRDDEKERFAVRYPGNSGEDKGKRKNREFDIKKVDGQGYREEVIFTGPMVQNLAQAVKTKVSGMPAVLEKNDDRRMEGKEKTKEKREKRGDKHKDKDTDKKDQGKDRDRGKERKKEEKAKEKSELGKSKDVNRINFTGATNNEASNLSSEQANAEGNLKKRKDVDINGFLHDNEFRPTKLQRPLHPKMGNGRKLEGAQTLGVSASDIIGIAANLEFDNKEHRKNGIVESQSLALSKEKPPSTTHISDEILEVPKEPPHPDLKYLDQILSVPKMDEWSDVVDNDWLFGGKGFPSRKAEASSVDVYTEPQVWNEAVYLESADIVALPYVIPY